MFALGGSSLVKSSWQHGLRQLPRRRQNVVSQAKQSVTEDTAFSPISLSRVVPFALAGFALIAADVNVPDSLHLLAPLDLAAHTTVVQNIPADVRLFLGRILLSDAPLVLGTVAQCVSLTRLVKKDRNSGIITLLCVGAALLAVGNVILLRDAPLTGMLKGAFGRMRPDGSTDSFAFPSGHATSASFVLATSVFLLLPKAFPPAANSPKAPSNSSPADNSMQKLAAICVDPKTGPLLYAALTVTTCVGRVVGDRHWCSDVMAGTLLGLGLAGITQVAEKVLQARAAKSTLQVEKSKA